MEFVITTDQLKRAMADLKIAESNGFSHCVCVFTMVSSGRALEQNQADYSDLWEKAHPTNGNLDWGRFQAVTKHNRFVDGKLVRIDPVKKP